MSDVLPNVPLFVIPKVGTEPTPLPDVFTFAEADYTSMHQPTLAAALTSAYEHYGLTDDERLTTSGLINDTILKVAGTSQELASRELYRQLLRMLSTHLTDHLKILPERLDSDGGDAPQQATKPPLFGVLLQDWQDFDVAVHALGVALGVFPPGDGYFWTDEVQGASDRGLAHVLTAMCDVGILDIQGRGDRAHHTLAVRWSRGSSPGIRVHPSLLGGAS